MNPELEALLKVWDAYLQAGRGEEADELLASYDSRLEEVCARTRIAKDLVDRAVQRAYQRWRWADDPKFPKALRNMNLE
jgi:hypothetical protein